MFRKFRTFKWNRSSRIDSLGDLHQTSYYQQHASKFPGRARALAPDPISKRSQEVWNQELRSLSDCLLRDLNLTPTFNSAKTQTELIGFMQQRVLVGSMLAHSWNFFWLVFYQLPSEFEQEYVWVILNVMFRTTKPTARTFRLILNGINDTGIVDVLSNFVMPSFNMTHSNQREGSIFQSGLIWCVFLCFHLLQTLKNVVICKIAFASSFVHPSHLYWLVRYQVIQSPA